MKSVVNQLRSCLMYDVGKKNLGCVSSCSHRGCNLSISLSISPYSTCPSLIDSRRQSIDHPVNVQFILPEFKKLPVTESSSFPWDLTIPNAENHDGYQHPIPIRTSHSSKFIRITWTRNSFRREVDWDMARQHGWYVGSAASFQRNPSAMHQCKRRFSLHLLSTWDPS